MLPMGWIYYTQLTRIQYEVKEFSLESLPRKSSPYSSDRFAKRFRPVADPVFEGGR